jgi:cation diffusion facilitator CzcD-associated flavoprotein CzcO
MPFTQVVILGGGPIGLLCAIEAKKYFRKVLIVEKRSEYSRNNVPALNPPLIKHLKEIGVDKDLWPTGEAGSTSLSFARFEEVLWQKAKANGVSMERGYVVSALDGVGRMPNGSYKQIVLTLSEWDEKKKEIFKDATRLFEKADLLVVASGGAAATDEMVTGKLGFSFAKLKARNYAAYGIFTPPKVITQQEVDEKLKFFGLFGQVISDKIAFPTADHNYL